MASTRPRCLPRRGDSPAAGRQSWREEARRDRLARAQIDRDREAARASARVAERDAAAQDRQAAADARRAARAQARADRAGRRAALAAWAAGHVTDLLFVPVIAVPGVLAWTAMAAYGAQPVRPGGAGAARVLARAPCGRSPPPSPSPAAVTPAARCGICGWARSCSPRFGAALNFAHGLTASRPGDRRRDGAGLGRRGDRSPARDRRAAPGPRRPRRRAARPRDHSPRAGRPPGRSPAGARRPGRRRHRAPRLRARGGDARPPPRPGPANPGTRRDPGTRNPYPIRSRSRNPRRSGPRRMRSSICCSSG